MEPSENLEQLKNAIDGLFEMPMEEMKELLPTLLDSIIDIGIESLIETVPGLLPRLMSKLEKIEIGEFIEELPEVSEKFMSILWDGAGILAEKNPKARAKLVSAGDVKVNFVATDSPMKGHLELRGGNLLGGADLLDPCDLKLYGPTRSLVGLLTGSIEPIKGFMAGQFKIEGNIMLGMKLTPVMSTMTEMFKE